MEYWRWWVVHLWVRGFFEVFATAAIAVIFARLGVIERSHAGAAVIASTGASIKEIVHDRAFSGPDLSAVRVVCVVETTGHEHVRQLHQALGDAGINVVG